MIDVDEGVQAPGPAAVMSAEELQKDMASGANYVIPGVILIRCLPGRAELSAWSISPEAVAPALRELADKYEADLAVNSPGTIPHGHAPDGSVVPVDDGGEGFNDGDGQT